MASAPKKAKVISREMLNGSTVRLTCQMMEPEELGFRGGQYIIVNSGIVMDNGKLGKRAYSIISSDSDQKCFEVIVKKIGNGVGSNFIHSINIDDMFEFSGPWGKTKPIEGQINDRSICCIATDTGITSFLGLLKGKAYLNSLKQADIFWMTSEIDYFIPYDLLKTWLPEYCTSQLIPSLSTVGNEHRWEQCVERLEKLNLYTHYDKVYLSGDGNVLGPIEQWFLAKGYKEEEIVKESYFHHESLKAPSTL